jgi:hypothetical protein
VDRPRLYIDSNAGGNIIKVGQIPTIATLEKDIQITAADPQTSGTVSSRRRRRAERNLPELSDADCPAGYSSCWTGVGNKVECLNTESDVTGQPDSHCLPRGLLLEKIRR